MQSIETWQEEQKSSNSITTQTKPTTATQTDPTSSDRLLIYGRYTEDLPDANMQRATGCGKGLNSSCGVFCGNYCSVLNYWVYWSGYNKKIRDLWLQ